MKILVPKHPPNPRAPKLVGFDTELMNVDPAIDDSGASAARALLREVPGLPANNGVYCEQDCGRLFLPGNGASVYIDLHHLELAGPECRDARTFVAQFHGMLGVAREAARQANDGRATPLRVHANNSDGRGNSWGGHLSVLVSRTAFDWIFRQRLHCLQWLASAQASSIVLTGAGKAGAENGRPSLPYQISQRADYFHCLSSIDTTRMRPLVNTRDEQLAGPHFARLHCIFHDTTLCHTAVLLRAGLMQVFLAMIEAQQADYALCFEEPLAAVQDFSADPGLRATARLLDGRRVTAVEHQCLLLEKAATMADAEGEQQVPGLRDLLDTWGRMLEAFRRDDRAFLARHLDWVAKQMVLERAATARGLDLSSPAMLALDFAWSDLEQGIYFSLEKAGAVERLASPEQVAQAAAEAPADTRAYPRSRLIRAFGGRLRTRIDWDHMVVARQAGKRLVVHLPDPGAGRQVHGDLDSLGDLELVQKLGVVAEEDAWRWSYAPQVVTSHWQGAYP